MSTTIIELSGDTWTQVYAGPTAAPIAVEKKSGSATVWLAIGASTPVFNATGHYLHESRIKTVELQAGENLYAYSVTPQINNLPTQLILTD